MNDPQTQSNHPRNSKGVLMLFALLVVWTAIIAMGTFRTETTTDCRRPLIVVATMSVFLGGWAWALRSRNMKAK